MRHSDEYYMKRALQEAEKARTEDEVPIGAVVVLDGKIIARGHNQRENKNDPTSHAEVEAIKKACKKLSSWRIPGCELYVTVEPCPMCAGLISASRIKRVIFGTEDLKGGALNEEFNLYEKAKLNHCPEVRGGVLKEECASIIKDYFKAKRQK